MRKTRAERDFRERVLDHRSDRTTCGRRREGRGTRLADGLTRAPLDTVPDFAPIDNFFGFQIPLGLLNPVSLFVEHRYEFLANDLALLLRIDNALESGQKLLGRIMHAEIDVEVIAKRRFDDLPLIFPQQAVVNEDADKLVAQRLVQQCRRHG